MKPGPTAAVRRKLYSYWVVVGLYALVFGWWMVFFWNQGGYLVRRMERKGVLLDEAQEAALRAASDESMRMFLFEGTFLILMLAASVGLVLRSLHREVAVHRQQRNFLSAVTHELKSPLASVRLHVESLLLGRVPEEKRERYLRHAMEDVDRVDRVADDLLRSARMAEAGPTLDLTAVDLGAFVRERIGSLLRAAGGERFEVELDVDPDVPVSADEQALETILRNLVGNAVKYGGKHVHACVRREADRGVLSVRDDGPGLRGADPERIFDAFVRGGDEDVRERPGVGLGLFMVRQLADAQGGSVRARNGEHGGLTVDVHLRLAAAVKGAGA